MVIISNQLYFIDDFNHLNLFEDHLQKKSVHCYLNKM